MIDQRWWHHPDLENRFKPNLHLLQLWWVQFIIPPASVSVIDQVGGVSNVVYLPAGYHILCEDHFDGLTCKKDVTPLLTHWNLSCTDLSILCVHPANVRRRYIVTSSLIGWAHPQNDPWLCAWCRIFITVTSHEVYGVATHRQLKCLFNNFFNLTTNKTSNLQITGPLSGESAVDSTQRESNAERVSKLRHHDVNLFWILSFTKSCCIYVIVSCCA